MSAELDRLLPWRTIRCANPFCREVMRTGKALVIGKVRGIEAEEKCPKCHEMTHWRAPDRLPAAPARSTVGASN